MLVLVSGFSYTPYAMFGEEFVVTFLKLVSLSSFSCTPDARFSNLFFLHTSC